MHRPLLSFIQAALWAIIPVVAQNDTTASTEPCRGLFTVAQGVQVRFSTGNLQYQPSTGLWRFAEQQTDVAGWKAGYANGRYKGWVDLFGWGTGMMPTNYSDKVTDYSAFVDWGIYCGLPTGDGLRWRTLTIDEWTYLLSKRPHARRLYALAYVCGRFGLVLLPDNWERPQGVYVKTGPREDYVNSYTAERWALLEAAGAVFLPCEEKRIGTEAQGSALMCRYWTASPNAKKEGEALYLLVDGYVPQAKSTMKSTGLSVRLVQEVSQ